MPILGAHMSIAGGMYKAFQRIREVGGEALQIFAKNQRQWHAPEMSPAEIQRFREEWHHTNPDMPVAIHGTYLINLAAEDPVVLERSVQAFADELRRTVRLHIPTLVMHPGSHMGRGIHAGLARLTENLDRAIDLSRVTGVTVLIENTAGQGTQLGATFEELAAILAMSRHAPSLGICLDTCHAFAAGYDLRTVEAYEQAIAQFDRVIGLSRLKLIHLNDSKKAHGTRVDRHEHIGRGMLGKESFRLILNDPRFLSHPMVIETPKENGLERDKENLDVLRSLAGKTGWHRDSF